MAGSIWTDIEPSMALLVACLPVCRPLLQPRKFWQMRKMSHAMDGDDEEYYESEAQAPKGYSSTDSHELRSGSAGGDGR